MTARRLVLLALLVLAAIPRLVGLGHPQQLMFDEAHYARDACTYVASDGCGIESEENLEHPPLGKWLIAGGIVTFGNDAFGWRIVPAIAGIASVALLYLLALRLGGSRVFAATAAALMALDPLHLVQSRIAMLDVFVTAFGLAAVLCAAQATRAMRPGRSWWLAGLAVTGGAATATKWSGAVFLALGLSIVLVRSLADRDLGDPVGAGATGATPTASSGSRIARPIVMALLVVLGAVVVYAVTFIGRIDGPWAASFVERQMDMWSFHSGLSYKHPYASPPWSWLLLKRPVAYLFATAPGGNVAEVLATGNPLLWWPALLAIGAGAVSWARGRAEPLIRVAIGGFVATFGMWLVFAPARSAMFLFYMTPVLPFMYLALARVLVRWKWGPAFGLVAALVPLLFLWPVLTAEPISEGGWHQRVLFEDCDGPGRTPEEMATPLVGATPGGGAPPSGWCWI